MNAACSARLLNIQCYSTQAIQLSSYNYLAARRPAIILQHARHAILSCSTQAYMHSLLAHADTHCCSTQAIQLSSYNYLAARRPAIILQHARHAILSCCTQAIHALLCSAQADNTFVVAHRPYNICCSTQAIQHLVAHRPYEDCSTQAIQRHVARRPYSIRRTVLAPYSPPRLVTHRSHQDDLVTHRSHTGTVRPPGDHVQTCLMWRHHDATMHGF